MSFLNRLKSVFSAGPARPDDTGYMVYVRCPRCGEIIHTRIDLRNDLSEDDDGNYTVRKTLVGGTRRCYQRLEMTLVFDASRQLRSRDVTPGVFVTREEAEAEVEVEAEVEAEDKAEAA